MNSSKHVKTLPIVEDRDPLRHHSRMSHLRPQMPLLHLRKKRKEKKWKKKWVYGFFITLGKHLCALSEIDIPSAPPSYGKTRKIHLRFGTSSIIYLTEALNWKGAVIAHQGYRKQELLAEGFQSKKPILSPTQNGHFDFSVLQTTFNQKGSLPSNVTHYSLSKTQKWEEFCIGK